MASMRTMSAPRVRSARASCEAPAGHPRQTPSPRPGFAKDSSRQSARSRRAVPEVPTATGRGATRCPRPGRRIQSVRAPSPRPNAIPRPQRRHPRAGSIRSTPPTRARLRGGIKIKRGRRVPFTVFVFVRLRHRRRSPHPRRRWRRPRSRGSRAPAPRAIPSPRRRGTRRGRRLRRIPPTL